MKEIKFDIEYDHSNESSKLLLLEGNFNYKQQIKNILEEFDFGRVQKAMKALNWKYWTVTILIIMKINRIFQIFKNLKILLSTV